MEPKTQQTQKTHGFFKTKLKAFTIVELVIVIAIVAILASVLIPTFSNIVEKADYSAAYQQVMAEFKDDSYTYMSLGYADGVPNGTVYTAKGYYFVSKDGELLNVTRDEAKELQLGRIKNIIFLIPDGAGFGTYDIANAYKQKYSAFAENGIVPGVGYSVNGDEIKRQATPITTNAIEGITVTGLYLDEFMIATANTLMYHGISDGATDSTTAGTALLCGVKTNYLMSGVTHDAKATANLLEVCRFEGKATGVVTTKCLIDATPCAATVHLLRRPDQKISYQEDANKQYMVNGIDVLLAYGSDGGYYYKDSTTLNEGKYKARDYGYSIVNNLESLNNVVNSGAKKIFSEIYECNGEYSSGIDYQANHILYDCRAVLGENLTLMDMAKGALKALSVNINDPDGFCLVIEGGAIDNAAEKRKVKEAVSEYLAFDEVFAYCVNWAKKRGDTIVVACPDHDSGGFYADPNSTEGQKATNNETFDTMDQVLDALYNGTVKDNFQLAGESSSHTTQNVPVWLYAPELAREAILENLGIPFDTNKDKVRAGRFHDGTQLVSNYEINNNDISPAILEALKLTSFGEATDELFFQIYEKGESEYGAYNDDIFTFDNGVTVKRNTNYWTDTNGTKHYFDCGYALYLTNAGDDYGIHVSPAAPAGTYPNRFYIPKAALEEILAYHD